MWQLWTELNHVRVRGRYTLPSMQYIVSPPSISPGVHCFVPPSLAPSPSGATILRRPPLVPWWRSSFANVAVLLPRPDGMLHPQPGHTGRSQELSLSGSSGSTSTNLAENHRKSLLLPLILLEIVGVDRPRQLHVAPPLGAQADLAGAWGTGDAGPGRSNLLQKCRERLHAKDRKCWNLLRSLHKWELHAPGCPFNFPFNFYCLVLVRH